MIVKPITTNNAMTGPPTNPTAGDPLFVYNSENQMILLQFEKHYILLRNIFVPFIYVSRT